MKMTPLCLLACAGAPLLFAQTTPRLDEAYGICAHVSDELRASKDNCALTVSLNYCAKFSHLIAIKCIDSHFVSIRTILSVDSGAKCFVNFNKDRIS